MARKNHKVLKRILSDSLTVGELKSYLEKLPQDLPVGVLGHFGEIHFCDKDCLDVRKGWVENPSKFYSKLAEDVEFFTMYIPDIGPEPD